MSGEKHVRDQQHGAPSPGGDRTAAEADATRPGGLARRVAGQGALLFSGFAIAQGCSFARNAFIGYSLSKGDFGIAATITLALQLLETLTDLGAERLIVQAEDGDNPRFMAAAHATLVGRGLLTALVLYFAAGPLARFFGIEEARWAFEISALVPMFRAFIHLDYRRKQRDLDNNSFLILEIAPQVAVLAMTAPALLVANGYAAVVWLSVAQAALAVLTSHLLAERTYEVSLDTAFLQRLIKFGWPIWLSAFPLIAVYQGDRAIVGKLFGMEALAGYTAAFMITMVPGMIVARVGHALMLPLFAETRSQPVEFIHRLKVMCEATAVVASLYAIFFVVAGGCVLPLAFGTKYAGLGTVVAWLGAMWSLRMLQAVPGMALMAQGDTRPLFTAGMLRAMALVLALMAASNGLGLTGVAAAGLAGEVASLVYVCWRLERTRKGLMKICLIRFAFLLPVLVGAGAAHNALPQSESIYLTLPLVAVLSAFVTIAGLALMPGLRRLVEARTTAAPQPVA